MAKSASSKLRAQVAKLYLGGQSYAEIAQALSSGAGDGAGVTIEDVRKILEHPENCRSAVMESLCQRQKDEIASLKKQITQSHRAEALFQALAQDLSEHVHPLEPPKIDVRKPTGKRIHEEDLCLALSDLHADQVTPSVEVGGIENYDFDVCAARLEQTVDTLVDFTQNNLNNYRWGCLHIFLNGDLVNGMIHRGAEYSHFRNSLKGAMKTGDLIALAVSDLSRHFHKIDIVGLPGNHGRITAKTNEADAHESLDYVAMETARQLTAKHKNIHWNIPHAYTHNKKIGPWWYHAAHGDQIGGGFAGLPWYGIEKKGRRKQSLHSSLGTHLDMFVYGHFHTATFHASHKGGFLINGAIPATSAYGYNRIDAYNEPAQWMWGTCDRFCTTWKVDIKPRRPAEQEKPVRYLVTKE